MKVLTVNQTRTLSILVMLMLICGFSGISYGEDALTLLDVQCEADGVAGTILSVTVKATIRANRDVENIRGWLTINGRIFSLIPKEFGGKSLGDLSAGQTKSFSITEPTAGQVIAGNARCGVHIEFREVNPPPEQPPEEPSGDQQPNQPQQPQETPGGTPTLSVSTTNPLTEATLHNSVVTLTLSGGTYARSVFDIRDAVSVSGITGVTIPWHQPRRKSDTQITIELEFDGNIDTDKSLTFVVGPDAIAGYNGPPLTAKIPVTAIQESLTASTVAPLTEATLHGSVVTLTLTGGTYARSVFDIRDATSVSGIDGVTIPWHDPDKNSDTQITVELEFDGNIDTDATLTFTVGADAIANYNGPALTAQVRVSAVSETIVASTPSPLTESTLHGSVVTLTLTGGTYARSVFDIRDAVSVSGIAGVTIPSNQPRRQSDTQITIELEFRGNIDTDATLTFTIGAGAIANYNGPTLTAKVSVTASDEVVAVPNPSDQNQADYIGGPWLWMIAKGSSIDSDQLDLVSKGSITENHVATHGVNAGDTVGRLQWTRGEIQPTTACETERTNVLGFTVTTQTCASNNVNELVNAIGLSQNTDINDYSAYALINIVSPRDQKGVMMGVGSDDTVKVWLNGEVVHTYTGGVIRATVNGRTSTRRTGRSTAGIQDEFRVNLKAGNNLLLVKVCDYQGDWGMFFGIYLDAADFTTAIPGEAPAPTESGPAVDPVDVNGDGVVNIQDLVLIASSFGQAGENPADVNGDGAVNIQDLVLAAGAIGNAAAAPALHTESIGMLTSAEVKQWLSEAQRFVLSDLTSQRGILFLEQLLAYMVPKETLLLANYPNPFNPETWIPYQLSKPAAVMITIYAANGRVVRQLALGHQPAGVYQSRSRAAYWDGRNAVGEPVASGLYFYTLTAGEFAATRKMLIRK